MPQVLLHICCGVCAGAVVERLRYEGFQVTGFFYNPNIHPIEEYEKRLSAADKVSKLLGFNLIKGSYDKDAWRELTKGLESEAEGRTRCEFCFRMRLEETDKKARELGIPFFISTLSVSPHKNALTINKIGRRLNKDAFLERDFKKQDGFKQSMEFTRTYNLYRQNYCGCINSQGEAK